MKKDVIISFKGTQQEGFEKDTVELVTEGKYYKKGENYYITYNESELTGMEGTTTTLKIEGKKITLLRFGSNNTQLIFEKGQNHICCYETEFGAFSVGVRSNKVDVDISDNGGKICAEYRIEVDNMPVSKNDFHMEIKEC